MIARSKSPFVYHIFTPRCAARKPCREHVTSFIVVPFSVHTGGELLKIDRFPEARSFSGQMA
jgi:hypothetical protein